MLEKEGIASYLIWVTFAGYLNLAIALYYL